LYKFFIVPGLIAEAKLVRWSVVPDGGNPANCVVVVCYSECAGHRRRL